MKRLLPLIALAVGLCWLVDGTDAALDLEVTLARGMENALRALLRGLCLPSTLTCTIAPACSGLRTAVAAALFGAFTARSRWIGFAIGALAGLWLNLARLLLIELGTRLSSDLGHTLHAFALPLIIAPLAAALLALLPRLKLPQRVLLATTSALLLALLLNAPAYTIDWEVLP